MLDQYDNFAAVTYHINRDGYDVPWGDDRHVEFYGRPQSLAPDFFVDGVWECPLRDYEYCVTERMMEPTDVTLELSGGRVEDNTWDVTATVCREGSGSGRDMRIYTVATLNNYPNPPDYSRNVLMQEGFESDITLGGGECTDVTSRVTFDQESWSHRSDIVVVAWAQEPASSWPADVYQAGQMTWPFPENSQLTTIEIEPSTAVLEVGQTQSFTATGKDQDGNDYPLDNTEWSVNAVGSGDGTFDPENGSDSTTFTATAAGICQVVCSQDGVSGHAVVEVMDPPMLTTIEISPADAELQVGGEVSYVATGKDQNGDDFELLDPMWALTGGGTGDGAFEPASGSATTVFTATATGDRQVTCTDGDVTGTATIVINEEPRLASITIDPATAEVDVDGAVMFHANGLDQYGESIGLDSPTWSFAGDGEGSLEPTTGSDTTTFTATKPGNVTITCTDGDISGSAAVTITGDAPILTAIEISPATADMQVGDALVFTATGTDQYGDDFALANPTWSTSGDGDGAFDPASGNATTSFTATTAGTTQIICSQDGVDGTATAEISATNLPGPRRPKARISL